VTFGLSLSDKGENHLRPKLSESQLAFIFDSILLHQNGHSLLSWWAEHKLNSRKNEFIFPESGEHLEKRFLGGVAHVHWAVGHRGHFQEALTVGVKTMEGWCYEIGTLANGRRLDECVDELYVWYR
jgi:hypothetical protein